MKLGRITELSQFYKSGLLEDTIPFWMQHNKDEEHGGFFNYLDQDGSVYGTDKPVWVLCRYTWLMSLLYNNVAKRNEWLEAAQWGINFIRKHCFDTDGRMFFLVDRQGRPLMKRRYLFTETFGVIAMSEAGLASGNEELIDHAKSLYKLILRYYNDPSLLPAKINPATRAAKGHSMPMILLATSQEIRKTGAEALYEQVIDNSLKEVCEHFMRYDEEALLESVGPNGERLDGPDGRSIVPGHAIETAWFMLREARNRNNDAALIEKACLIIDWSLKRGWDEEFGGILYYTDVEGKPCVQYEHDMKLWWPHNETLYACLLAYHLTGQDKYAQWYEKVHAYAFSHFPDAQYGEWFKYLHRDGTVSHRLKGNIWAGPFHLPRMQYNCWQLLEEMKASRQ
ncbi:MAG: AGE family epimerase/isomerase [Sedimentisphaerales bacterium]|nr:AGE family epimerase/isomerase [Sedimentisphaerales bacterium]